jgi:hypothetical protein
MGAGAVIGVTLALLVLWIAALVLLVKHKNEMPSWAVALGIVCLFLPKSCPIITIMLALLVRKEDQK